METTINELCELFHWKKGARIIRMNVSLINKIRFIDSDNIEITDKPLQKIIEKFRAGGTLTFKDVCEKYNISRNKLTYLIRMNKISYYKLDAERGNKFLFLKSELEEQKEIFIYRYEGTHSVRTDFSREGHLFFQIFDIANGMSEIDKECLRLYYFDNKTLEEIGKKFNFTRERARQVISRAKIRLAHIIRYAFSHKYNEESFRAKYYRLKSEYDFLYEKFTAQKEVSVDTSDLSTFEKKLSELDVSIRCMNFFEAAELETIGDLVKMKRSDILKFRNLGKKTLSEIDQILKNDGLHLMRE